MTQDDDFDRSFALAELAIEKMRSYGLSTTPRNFEVWYVYVEGINQKLSDHINDILIRKGDITQSDINSIYDIHLSQDRLSEQIDSVGGEVIDELDRLTVVIGNISVQVNRYGEDLAGASDQLGSAVSRESVKAVIETLLRSTKTVQKNNRKLEEKLQRSLLEVRSLQQNLEIVRNESLMDALTSLGNRKFYNQSMSRLVKSSHQHHKPLSLIVADIDFFKRFNDIHGHLTGDHVLRLVGLALKQNLKGQDIACRYGGEEFAVILPDTSIKEALAVAEHIRRSVQSKELIKKSTQEVLGRVTISMGVATLKDGDTATSLYERADHFLYAAKRAGRNRVMAEGDPETEPQP